MGLGLDRGDDKESEVRLHLGRGGGRWLLHSGNGGFCGWGGIELQKNDVMWVPVGDVEVSNSSAREEVEKQIRGCLQWS